MLALINENRSLLEQYDFSFVAGSPMIYHCHHFNLFFDQTIDDALGVAQGGQVRARAAYEASSQLLNALISNLPPTTPEERLDLAGTIFSALGHGALELDITPGGGKVLGRSLHYGSRWKAKYGGHVKRHHPADGFAAGYIAAATEAAFGLALGSIECVETGCVALGGDHCEFVVRQSGQTGTPFGVAQEDIESNVPKSLSGIAGADSDALVTGLREFLAENEGDNRGVFEPFGLFLTHSLANYYSHCTNRTLDALLRDRPGAVDVARELFRECGRLFGFYTFGGILTSPEWDALAAPVRGEPEQVIGACIAVARALGHGGWALEAYEPEKSLILRSPGTCESVYRRAAYPIEEGGCCYLFQGAALSMMQLASRVRWDGKPDLSGERYAELQKDNTWRVEETHCVAAGNSVCRVVIS